MNVYQIDFKSIALVRYINLATPSTNRNKVKQKKSLLLCSEHSEEYIYALRIQRELKTNQERSVVKCQLEK